MHRESGRLSARGLCAVPCYVGLDVALAAHLKQARDRARLAEVDVPCAHVRAIQPYNVRVTRAWQGLASR